MSSPDESLVWHKALDPDELPEGRVKPVTCENFPVRLTRFDGTYAALDPALRCPRRPGDTERGAGRCLRVGPDTRRTLPDRGRGRPRLDMTPA